MGKHKTYPHTKHSLETAIRKLIETNLQLNGKRAVNPKPPYFSNFCVKGLHGRPSDTPIIIPGPHTELDMKCAVHRESFVSNPRALLNTSKGYSKSTCRKCEREYGVGRHFTTLGEAETMMKETDTFDWMLDIDKLPQCERSSERILEVKENLPLRCKRMKWGRDEPCNMLTQHNWGNIQYALKNDPNHLHCQGKCDAARKGKARRKPLKQFQKTLLMGRKGSWMLSNPDNFRKISEHQWFTHSCGNEKYCSPWKILNYAADFDLPPDSSRDCPYCAKSSPLNCLDASIPHYAIWVSVVSEGKVQFKGQTFPTAPDELQPFECSCGCRFTNSQKALQKNRYFGCPDCSRKAETKQRAWSHSEAMIIVQRRNMRLRNDPGSYTSEAIIEDSGGRKMGYGTILELVKALPAKASGYSKTNPLPAHIAFKSGTPYSEKDIDFLRKNSPNMTYAQFAKELGRTVESVRQKCYESGIQHNHREHSNRIFSVKDNAFSIDTPESCYWAGLLASDGTLTDKGDISLELKGVDEGLLQGFAKFLEFTGTLSYRTVANTAGRGIYACIRFRSTQIRKDLSLKFGIVPRKTHCLPSPAITATELCYAYMVGLLEGDGHIKRDPKGGLKLNFISASPDLFQWFIDKVKLILGKEVSRNHKAGKSEVTETMTVWYSDAEKVRDTLLKAIPGKMARKWNR